MLATRMAATGTSVSASPEFSRVRITARSFLQNSLSIRFSAIGIDVPGVAMDQRHPLDARVVGRVEAVIHARRQPERHELAVAVRLDQRGIAEQVDQRVRRALDLVELAIPDACRTRR